MKRIQGFEFNDQAWLPQSIRDAIVETLGRSLEMAGAYENVVPVFTKFCEDVQCQTILDLGSGSGIPISILIQAMEKAGAPVPQFIMSDLFPDREAMEAVCKRHPHVVTMIPIPVDATDVSLDIDCQAIMLNNAFHHFTPELGVRILTDAVNKRRAIFIVEGLNGEISRFASFFLRAFAAGTQLLFHSEKKGWDRLVHSMVTLGPLLPMGAWDGLVSTLRIHKEGEMNFIVSSLGDDYKWDFLEVSYSMRGKSVVFMGKPK